MDTEKPEVRKVKIEGEAFERVKVKKDAYERLAEEVSRSLEAAHKDFWDTIYAEFPQFNHDDKLSLDQDHKDLGFYVVYERKREGLPSLLSSLVKAAKAE